MKIVGITGGIGSGKSTIAQVFEFLGIPVYYADTRAKALYSKPEIKQTVVHAFGEKVYTGKLLNKEMLAHLVFNDAEKLKQLNAIIHPAVNKDFIEWKAEQNAPYVLKEAAILIESKGYKECDVVILVTAPKETRIERVLQRDLVSREEIEARMSKQYTDEEKLPFAHYIIDNSGTKSIIKQVLDIHHKLLNS